MTQLVGIYCTTGVVIATDSAATFSTGHTATIGQQMVEKIYHPCDHIIYTSTGAIGIAQLINDMLRSNWTAGTYKNKKTPEEAMHAIGQGIGQLLSQYLQLGQMQKNIVGEANASLAKSMIAFPVNRKPYLFQFDYTGTPEMASVKLPFVTLGSGQPIADPFLAFLARLLWPNRQPTLAEGRLAAAWTIDHVRQINPGGVGGNLRMAIMEEVAGSLPKVTELNEADLQEHRQRIVSAEAAITKELVGGTAVATPELPVPPATTIP